MNNKILIGLCIGAAYYIGDYIGQIKGIVQVGNAIVKKTTSTNVHHKKPPLFNGIRTRTDLPRYILVPPQTKLF